MIMRFVVILAVCAAVVCLSSTAAAQATVTILFDGGEAGIEDGMTDFSYMGSNWEGGFVGTNVSDNFFASGTFAYLIDPEPGGALITFDTPWRQ